MLGTGNITQRMFSISWWQFSKVKISVTLKCSRRMQRSTPRYKKHSLGQGLISFFVYSRILCRTLGNVKGCVSYFTLAVCRGRPRYCPRHHLPLAHLCSAAVVVWERLHGDAQICVTLQTTAAILSSFQLSARHRMKLQNGLGWKGP